MILVHQNFNQSRTSSLVTCMISHSKYRADMGSCASCPASVAEFIHHKSTFSLPAFQPHEITPSSHGISRLQFECKHSSYHRDHVRSCISSKFSLWDHRRCQGQMWMGSYQNSLHCLWSTAFLSLDDSFGLGQEQAINAKQPRQSHTFH